MDQSKSIDTLFKELDSLGSGLTSGEVSRRLEIYGPNVLDKDVEINVFKIFIHQFMDPLIYILFIAALITAFIKDWVDAGVIMIVVILNAIIGFFQEYKAERSVRALKSLSAPKAIVVREDKVEEIESKDIVPGDIVILSSGTRVPADIRLYEAIRLEADESALTGESTSVSKNTEPQDAEVTNPGDIKNCVFMGTLILSGRGKGIVIATGKNTQLGRISHEVATVRAAETPLQIQLNKMSTQIGIIIILISIVAVILGVLIGESFYDMLLTGIALAVGAIPEGLPVVVTITFAVGVNRMAMRNVIIRKLPAVETLGSTTVIASDKTGTMTKNEMTVVEIFSGGVHYNVTGVGFSPEGSIMPVAQTNKEKNQALEMCLLAGFLANESFLEYDEKSKEYRPKGDPTEVSLITSALKGGLHEGSILAYYEKLDEIPFESERLYMASLHRNHKDTIAYIKGAPDRILQMCDRELDQNGQHANLDIIRINNAINSMGEKGLRVLAMAYKPFPHDTVRLEPETMENGAVFLGIQGMFDPPREEVYKAIELAKRSGIRVIMVTGDHVSTAISISRKLRMTPDERQEAITGRDIDTMSDDELYQKLATVSIFSRVAPIHKLRIVQQLIKRGEIVAVTGDGVNDTPALKAAHIGIAMGRSGTDAAKETSDMIITDDNFASMISAVKEGRVIFANIRKVTLFLLSSGLGQVLLILSCLILRLPLPLLPGQIIWMNLATSSLQAMAMAFEPPEKHIEFQKPRNRSEPVISRMMIERLLFIGIILAAGTLGVFIWQLNIGADISKARTMALTTLVLFQLFNVFNTRSETRSVFTMNPLTNPFLFFSVIASILAQAGVIYLEPLQNIFQTKALDISDWLVIIPVALTVVIAVDIEKAVRRYLKKT